MKIPTRLVPARWWVMTIFYLSSTINYLDRQILSAVAPAIKEEFHLSYEQYGLVLTAFYIVYMISSPLMGWLLDKLGLNLGASLAIAWYSLAGLARAFTQGLMGLTVANAAVAFGEAAGIPSTAKAAQTYLKQEERALGSALSQFGLSLGFFAAAYLANFCLARWGWRSAFLLAGWLGFLWIPLWWWAAKQAPAQPIPVTQAKENVTSILGQRQTWGFILANVLGMGNFALWMGWTTIYLTKTFSLSTIAANEIAPIPQLFAYAGGLLGGFASMKLIQRGSAPQRARRLVLLASAIGMLSTALVPLAPTPMWAIAAISLSTATGSAWGVNLYTLPLDAFGSNRAAFAVSLLTAGYGLLQIFISPWIGRQVDQVGFAPVCTTIAIAPLIAYAILELTKSREIPPART
jgi:MFS transporter, ACS family, hexuronate transporter